MKSHGLPAGRKTMALGFYPPIQREVMVVTDYEMLAIVLMIIT